jgi:calcium-dependent protein kinase
MGGFGYVCKAIKKDTGEERAIKIILKNDYNNCVFDDEDNTFQSIKNEIDNMTIVNKDNQNTVKLYEYFDMRDEFVMIMELCDCNLADILNQKKKKKEKFNFNEILEILMQLNNTFKILVKNKVIHRILKLENILLKRENGQNIWKLMDYGANNISEQDYIEVRKVDLYIAPEIISGEIYNNKCELWSLGIILYILYFQEVPYIGVINEAVLDKIRTKGKTLLKKSGNENFDDLISRLLEADPNKRISWEEYFKHPFFCSKF